MCTSVESSSHHRGVNMPSIRQLLANAFKLSLPLVVCCSQPAFAAPGMTTTFKIASIFVRESMIDVIGLTPITSSMGCSRTDAIRLDLSAANYAALSSAIMTAYATNKSISAWVTSCDPADGVSHVIAISVTS